MMVLKYRFYRYVLTLFIIYVHVNVSSFSPCISFHLHCSSFLDVVRYFYIPNIVLLSIMNYCLSYLFMKFVDIPFCNFPQFFSFSPIMSGFFLHIVVNVKEFNQTVIHVKGLARNKTSFNMFNLSFFSQGKLSYMAVVPITIRKMCLIYFDFAIS